MSDALGDIEGAIREVTKARLSVTRKKTRQVSAGPEIDRLKSVAYAWFQTHRESVANHSSHPDLAQVDAAYQAVMQATGKFASRKTYGNALKDAKQALILVRIQVATTPNVLSLSVPTTSAGQDADPPPNFAPLAADPKMQDILNRRWGEVHLCIKCGANLAATVMMGGLLESLLLARINSSSNQAPVFNAAAAPRDKAGRTLQLGDWTLAKMVDVAHELRWITKSAKDVGHVLRDFRNYIHPHKEYTEGYGISEDDAHMFWDVTKGITRQLLSSAGKCP
jgi:hypothetical protein